MPVLLSSVIAVLAGMAGFWGLIRGLIILGVAAGIANFIRFIGIGILSYAFFKGIIEDAITDILDRYSVVGNLVFYDVPVGVFLALAGMHECLQIVLGAYMTKALIVSTRAVASATSFP